MKRMGRAAAGMVAATCGTAALNSLTYLDMAVRGRAPSSVPAQAAGNMAEALGVELAAGGDDQTGEYRSQGLGAVLGYAAGLGTGLLYPLVGDRMERWPLPVQAAALTLAAMAAGNLPSIAMGITDPRSWSGSDWTADAVPHLAYGWMTAAVYRGIRGGARPSRRAFLR